MSRRSNSTGPLARSRSTIGRRIASAASRSRRWGRSDQRFSPARLLARDVLARRWKKREQPAKLRFARLRAVLAHLESLGVADLYRARVAVPARQDGAMVVRDAAVAREPRLGEPLASRGVAGRHL